MSTNGLAYPEPASCHHQQIKGGVRADICLAERIRPRMRWASLLWIVSAFNALCVRPKLAGESSRRIESRC